MSRRSKVDAVIIVIDAGNGNFKGSSDFIQKAKLCVRRIVERRIFTSGNDEIGLIVLGSKETRNPLQYSNVCVEFPLALPTWKMISFVEESLQESEIQTDWVDGIIVGIQMFKDELEGKQFTTTTLVLITDCIADVDEQHVEGLISEINSMEISFVAIGPELIPSDEIHFSNENSMLTNGQHKSGIVLARIIDEVNDAIACSFNDAMDQLLHLQKKSVTPTAWNILLEIGPDIRIPLSGYRKISEENFPTWNRDSNNAMIVREKTFFLKTDGDDEDSGNPGEAVDENDVCSAYHLGSTIVPTNEADEEAMEYNTLEKSFKVLCFTAAKNAPQYLFMGNGVLYFTLQNGRTEAGPAFSAFVQAMQKLNMVAIVRRVYQRNSDPYLGVLFPKIKKDCEYLVYTELPFAEDVRDDLILEPLEKEVNALSDDQLSTIDELIDAMDLMHSLPDGTEAFKSKEITNVTHHKLFSCISHRALHPSEKIPPLREEINEFISSPFVDSEYVKNIVMKMSKVFDLKEVVHRRREENSSKQPVENGVKSEKENLRDEPGTSAMSDTGLLNTAGFSAHAKVQAVGTTNPESDFLSLLSQGVPFAEAFDGMQGVIGKIVERSISSKDNQKALCAVRTLRNKSAEIDPSIYNGWIINLKNLLMMGKKEEFWNMIISEKLGLISATESVYSPVSEKQAVDLLSKEIKETQKMEYNIGADDDDDDLLNDL